MPRVALQFRDAGIRAASIDGGMTADQRRDLVERLRIGDIRVLTSCQIISEGFDAPAVGGAILLRPTQSFALYRQQIGRCLRPKADQSVAVIVDHVGNCWRHGLPDDPHVWSLDSEPRKRSEYGPASRCRKCKACEVVFPLRATGIDCPTPGTEGCLFRPVFLPERDGVLEEVTASTAAD
jgi:DNA repair protein RadD